MVEQARSWFKENSTLIYFLIAQMLAIGAGAASILSYSVKLETRVEILETRGAAYSVKRMDEMTKQIAVLEEKISQNEDRIERLVQQYLRKPAMTYNSVVISSGHGKYVRGASGIIDEVDEARKVTQMVAEMLVERGVMVQTFHDDKSKSQNENLNTIVNFHNKQQRELDISVHFNAYEQKEGPMGCEVLYVSQQTLAAKVSSAIAAAGFINRGAKKRTDLFFLNKTSKPAILLEICFVDSQADVDIYDEMFEDICGNIADVIGGDDKGEEITPEPPAEVLFHTVGRCSYFGGPEDMGVSDDEGLAFIQKVEQAPHLFLPEDTPGTENKGLARKLNPFVHYVACRWDYNVTPKSVMLKDVALVRNTETGLALKAFPADWGPHQNTGRVADLSPCLMEDLGVTTDDEVEVIFPYRED